MHEIEADFWMAPDGANDPDKVKGNRARTRINLKPYLDRIHRVRGTEEYLGFMPVVAPGHTPGHTCWLLTAPGGGGFMALGDVVHVSAIQISHPDAGMIYDLDKDPSRQIAQAHPRYGGLRAARHCRRPRQRARFRPYRPQRRKVRLRACLTRTCFPDAVQRVAVHR